MKNAIVVLALSVCVTLSVHAHAIAPFGTLPDFGEKWVVQDQGVEKPFEWIVFSNTETKDKLCFACYEFEGAGKRDINLFTDSSHDIFPGGKAVWNWKKIPREQRGLYEIVNIKYGVVDIEYSVAGKKISQKSLECCIIQEHREKGPNLMVWSYVMVFGDTIIFAQHMSEKPSTSELAHDVAMKLVRMKKE